MKITSRNWTLPTNSEAHFDELIAYARSKGVPVDQGGDKSDPKDACTGIWFASNDGLHCCALETPTDFINEAQFKSMCDAYAAKQ
jgi:hypothetical protein